MWGRVALGLLAGLLIGCSSGASTPNVIHSRSRLSAPPPRPFMMFVSVASDDTFSRVALVRLDDRGSPGREIFVTNLRCDRVYFTATRGICLASTNDTEDGKPHTSWWAEAFDARFERTHRFPLSGFPSRVRVSPDGRLAAATVFEHGHSYAENGFSTRTTFLDLESGSLLGDLEQFETRRDGAVVKARDYNFWGVTFSKDSDRFFATLDTAGTSYLIEGSVNARAATILRPGAECPSLSPDNTRIVFKKRLGNRSRGWWQPALLDLSTHDEHLIASETRSLDDQVEWLDNDRVVYHLTGGTTAADLWSLRVDGSKAPELFLPSAYSPAVVR